MSKSVIIEKYNPQWPVFFEKEAQKIKSVMKENVIEIHHVGSTSVPFLAAKPIIDIILATRDLNSARKFLISKKLGYRYKGEYNLPLRDLYGKKDEFEIYLHVHRVDSPEIELNLLFRNYLRNHQEARKQYEAIKLAASSQPKAAEKVETGITKYNLMKNDFIVSILKKAGFSSVCPRFVTQKAEAKFFNMVKDKFSPNSHITKNSSLSEQNPKKIILYKGTELIGAAEIVEVTPGRFSINFAWTNDNEKLLKKFSRTLEDWIKIRTPSTVFETNTLILP
ncbi:MAG: GrpB family protein [Alphaproteobacteria bacterium]|nr:GrpB family protein [Alphaproteobacteria bacterium]